MASNPARSQCVLAGLGPEIHCELPPASAMRPSIDVAAGGHEGPVGLQPRRQNGAFCAAASSAHRPVWVSMPALQDFRPTAGVEIGIPPATRHDGCPRRGRIGTGRRLPVVRQGSRFTTSVGAGFVAGGGAR
jgi:hypothetical protein